MSESTVASYFDILPMWLLSLSFPFHATFLIMSSDTFVGYKATTMMCFSEKLFPPFTMELRTCRRRIDIALFMTVFSQLAPNEA